MVKKGLLEQYLLALAQDPSADQYALFQKLLLPHIAAYGTKRYGRFVQTGNTFDPDKWFRRETEKLLLSRFLPMSLNYLETSYRQALILPDKDGKTVTVRQLAERVRGPLSLDLQLALSESIIRLTELVYTSAPQVSPSFALLVDEISRFRNAGGSADTAGRIAAAEQQFLQALEQQALTEQLLREAERRHVPFGERYSLSFQKNSSIAPITDPAADTLDRITREAE